jgi:adenosylcobinamide-phosphate synthase
VIGWSTSILLIPGALVIALCLDVVAGEPPAAWHPVVWMGQLLTRLGRRLPKRSPAWGLAAGSAAWLVGAAVVGGLAYGVQQAVVLLIRPDQSWARALAAATLIGIMLKPLFAWRLLREEVAAVESALHQGIDAGRRQVGRLASRDISALTETEVRETAIETLAENLNDSVIAPLLWFVVGGLPAAALYRFANTADAMWGYRGPWEWCGKWAARSDDCLSFIPARLTAIALISPRAWPLLGTEAGRTPSPNSGWPMSAMALRLGVRLGKPGVYVLNAGARAACPADVARGIAASRSALGILAPAFIAIALACAMAGIRLID